MSKDFGIKKLIAWTPSVKNEEEGALDGDIYKDFHWSRSEKYIAKKVPKSHMRRMSQLSKMTVDLAMKVTNEESFDHAVFSSRYGELVNTVDLIKMLCRSEELSPTKFSQSVHNTSSGLFSILSGSQASMESVSSGENSFSSGLVSALSYIFTHPHQKVLYVYSDDQVPKPLFSHADFFDREKIGVAMLLTSEGVGLKASVHQEYEADKPRLLKKSSQARSFLKQFFTEKLKNINLQDSHYELQISLL